VNDDEFNATKLDFRGKPAYSSMIAKLCEYNRRSEFIIQTLVDFIAIENVDKDVIQRHKKTMDDAIPYCNMCNKKENYLVKNTCCDCVKYCLLCMDELNRVCQSETKKVRPKCPSCKKVLKYEQHYIENPYISQLSQKHIIVMSHNLNILKYMYNKFVCKNLASVGYYIGGMSETELKKTETKQIVLSTYMMSSEGLDIPTLNAEFLITPKSDIEQVVGRCLRARHAFANPIIYDFIDSHDVFKNQWIKRKAYYKKQNYKIISTSNHKYNLEFDNWKVIHNNEKTSNFWKNSPLQSKVSSSSDEDENSDNEVNTNRGKCLLKLNK